MVHAVGATTTGARTGHVRVPAVRPSPGSRRSSTARLPARPGGWRAGRTPPWSAGAIRDGRRRCSRGWSPRTGRATVPASCSAARDAPSPPAERSSAGSPTCSKTRRPGRDDGTSAGACRRPLVASAPRRRAGPRASASRPGCGRQAPGQRHGVAARRRRADRHGRDVEGERRADRRPSSRAASTRRTWARGDGRARCAPRRTADPAGGQVAAERVVGEDGSRGRPPCRRRRAGRRCAPAADPGSPRSCTLGTSADTTDGRAHAHGLERGQPVALGERDVGEGPGAAVEPREHGVGDRAGEDDAVGLGRPSPSAPPGRADDDQRPRLGQRAAGPGGRPARGGPGSCAARGCRPSAGTRRRTPDPPQQCGGRLVVGWRQVIGATADDGDPSPRRRRTRRGPRRRGARARRGRRRSRGRGGARPRASGDPGDVVASGWRRQARSCTVTTGGFGCRAAASARPTTPSGRRRSPPARGARSGPRPGSCTRPGSAETTTGRP